MLSPSITFEATQAASLELNSLLVVYCCSSTICCLNLHCLAALTGGKVAYPKLFDPNQQQRTGNTPQYHGAPAYTGGTAAGSTAGRREDLWSANNIGRDGSAFEDAKQVHLFLFNLFDKSSK